MLSQIAHKLLGPKIPDVQYFSPDEIDNFGRGFHYNGKKFVSHNDLKHHETALYRLAYSQRLFLTLAAGTIVIFLLINWHATLVFLVAALTLLYFFDLLFNLYLIQRSFTQSPEVKITEQEINSFPESDWPTYTIFCPLYKEWEVLPQFVTAMNDLDYPKDKLQVMLLLEEDDAVTIEKARSFNLPDYFDIVVVPHSLPKTKPKACNYGLTKARGERIVIYDAEDVPDPKQLKKAVIAFTKVPPHIICIQAKLNFYNPHQNILTRVFTAEYSLWFDLVLTGLQSISAPIPLGGTSNHFRLKDLHLLKGWDAFNVTEDCDLGIRLVKKGYKTALIDSTTLEEANSDMKNWFWQRTRWIKGYIQTYLVHMRRPHDFLGHWKEPHVVTFQLVVGGKVLSMLINPIMWVITISYFVFRPIVGPTIESFFPTLVLYMGTICLVIGNFLYMYYYMIGCAKRGHDDIIKYAFLVPIYWLAMSAAAYVSIYKLITAPHHWSKTKHGLHLDNSKATQQAAEKIGRRLVDEDLVHKKPTIYTPKPLPRKPMIRVPWSVYANNQKYGSFR